MPEAPDGRAWAAAQAGLPGPVWSLGPDPAAPDPGESARALPAGGDLPTHLAVHPFVVANEHSGQLAALAVDPDGVAGAPPASVAMPGVSYVEVEAA